MLLVVDDDAGARVGMIRLLAALGYEAVGLASGAEALAHMRAHKPGLVILDYRMPEMDGLEVLSAMRADALLRDVPVILCSADEGPIQETAMTAGANGYIAKRSLDVVMLETEFLRLIGPAQPSVHG